MRTIAACLLMAGVAFADAPDGADGPLDITPAFSGTIVSTFPDGRQTRLWLEPDGAYQATSRAGKMTSGRWKLKGERMCLRQHRPLLAPFEFCTALPARLDTPWPGKSAFGQPVTIELAPGR